MPDLDLHAIAERYHRALNAKPSKGPITDTGIAAITDSVADVPELLAETERLREHATNDAKFRARVIDALLDALGITDDTTPEDARQILDGCSCDGEEGTLHLVWHLGQKVERLTRWKAEALPVMDGLQELGRALGLSLGARITGPDALAEVRRLREKLDQPCGSCHPCANYGESTQRNDSLMEALERTETWGRGLAAKVAAVEALLERVENRMMATARPDEIRKALEVEP